MAGTAPQPSVQPVAGDTLLDMFKSLINDPTGRSSSSRETLEELLSSVHLSGPQFTYPEKFACLQYAYECLEHTWLEYEKVMLPSMPPPGSAKEKGREKIKEWRQLVAAAEKNSEGTGTAWWEANERTWKGQVWELVRLRQGLEAAMRDVAAQRLETENQTKEVRKDA